MLAGDSETGECFLREAQAAATPSAATRATMCS
jgi:hypothetical protein